MQLLTPFFLPLPLSPARPPFLSPAHRPAVFPVSPSRGPRATSVRLHGREPVEAPTTVPMGAQHTLIGAQHTLIGAQYILIGASSSYGEAVPPPPPDRRRPSAQRRRRRSMRVPEKQRELPLQAAEAPRRPVPVAS